MKRLSFIFLSLALIISINAKSQKQEETKVQISTDYGKIVIKLYNETPLHRDNFIKLVKESYFDGTLFHRVIKDFMIQGGDPDSKNAKPGQMLGEGGPTYRIPAEIKTPLLFHKKGVLAAARDNNPQKESSGSQFYIVQGKVYTKEQLTMFTQKYGIQFTEDQIKAYSTVGGTPHLDGNYTVFGEVIEGMDIVEKIAIEATDKNDRPLKDITMKVKIIK